MQKVNTAAYQTDCFVGKRAVATQPRKRTLSSTVTNFNNGSEASWGSDNKNKLHIAEDDSLLEPEVAKADATTPEDSHNATTTVLPHNGSLNGVKRGFVSAEEEEAVEEILQQGDTAIIYPEAPEDEQSPAETGGADANGTPDSQLHTCPYCSRSFKHKSSLKVHIKYRHETSKNNYNCPHCSYTYYHRWKLERHMMRHHRGIREQVTSKLEGINSVKGFISPPTTQTTPVVSAPACGILKETESKPLQEQLPVTQIKSEPVEYECKPVTAAPATSAGTNGVVNGGTAQPAVVPAATLPQGVAMVVPTVGLMSPISINLNDLQNVLKVAMDGNILRQVLGTANGVVTQGKQGIVVQQPQQQIISLPAFVDHDGTTKIIINYSISPAAAATTATTQPAPLVAKNNPPLPPTVTTAAAPTPEDRTPTPEAADLTIVKAEPESVPIIETEAVTQTEPVKTSDAQTTQLPKVSSTSTCLLCDDCPDNLEALHLLQHRKAANGEAVDSAALDPSYSALLSKAGVMLEECVDDLLSLLKTYFASNTNPSKEELTKISESVSIPVDVVRKWFAKMNFRKNVDRNAKVVSKKTKTTNSSSENASCQNGEAEEDSTQETSDKASSESGSESDCSPLRPKTEDLIVKSEPEDPEASLETLPPTKQQEQPMNLTCVRKEQLEGQPIYVATPQTGRPVNIFTGQQLCTLAIITGSGTRGCLSAINIPQLTYTYNTTAFELNSHKEKRPESSSGSVSTVEEQNDSSSASPIKKQRLEPKPCKLCSKVFRRASCLSRHKYEHTGKRPHECNICKKAFKHKHHLIEHSRLHSGEKPYQCDKCEKRFGHSGSYSQHMNSNCKKEGPNSGSG